MVEVSTSLRFQITNHTQEKEPSALTSDQCRRFHKQAA